MKLEIIIIICFFVGALIYLLIKSFCSCSFKVVEGQTDDEERRAYLLDLVQMGFIRNDQDGRAAWVQIGGDEANYRTLSRVCNPL